MLAELQRDMMAAVEQMPDDWAETELGWYLVHRAEMYSAHHFANRIRRKAFGACGEEPPAVMSPVVDDPPSRAPRLRKDCNR